MKPLFTFCTSIQAGFSNQVLCSRGVTWVLQQLMTHPDTFDSCTSDLLAVVELDALQPLTAFQVLQSDVCDQRTVIQLHHLQPLLTTHTATQVSNPIICYQLTMR